MRFLKAYLKALLQNFKWICVVHFLLELFKGSGICIYLIYITFLAALGGPIKILIESSDNEKV